VIDKGWLWLGWLWVARLGWLLAAWALVTGRPQVVALGLVLMVTHLWERHSVEIAPRPQPQPASGVDVDRWGPRPAVMTRCVECDRNVWPACRCALIRAGHPMMIRDELRKGRES
jgi:hypothetical protein